jgi:hypothetical protein
LRNWVHKNNTSMPSLSFQISSSFLHKSINCNNKLHFITAWMEVLHMKSFTPNMVLIKPPFCLIMVFLIKML